MARLARRDQILQRNEMTRCANRRHRRRGTSHSISRLAGERSAASCWKTIRLGLTALDMRKTIFKRDQTAINNEKLGVGRALPVLPCVLIRRTFVPTPGCRK